MKSIERVAIRTCGSSVRNIKSALEAPRLKAQHRRLASRERWQFQEEAKSVAPRACWKFQEKPNRAIPRERVEGPRKT